MLAKRHMLQRARTAHQRVDLVYRQIVSHEGKNLMQHDDIVEGAVSIVCGNAIVFPQKLQRVARQIGAIASRPLESVQKLP